MKKMIVGVLCGIAAVGAVAAEHQVKMMNNGASGAMVFEPAFLKVAKGDSVKFIKTDVAHNSVAMIVPPGAVAWKGKMDEEISIKLDKEGVYVYACEPHKVMAMVGVIQVGKAVNLAAAKKESEALSNTFVMNKDRLSKSLEQVK